MLKSRHEEVSRTAMREDNTDGVGSTVYNTSHQTRCIRRGNNMFYVSSGKRHANQVIIPDVCDNSLDLLGKASAILALVRQNGAARTIALASDFLIFLKL